MRSKVRLRSLGDREQALVEKISIVLGADRLLYRTVHLEPALHHGERFVERVGVLDRHQRGHVLAAGLDGEALDDMQLFAVRRAKIIDVAVLGGEADSIDDQRVAVLVMADRLAEPRRRDMLRMLVGEKDAA